MPVRLTRYLPIILILIFAAYLRTAYIGEQSFSADGAVHMLKALAMARDGDFPLIGTPMSTGLWHSPLPIWFYAIPSVFTSDPRLARLFTVMMNLFALCLVYRIAHRYFNPRTAILAAFLYAMHPVAVVAAYPIWNPNLGAPFVFGYLITGLLGYTENKAWARIAHAPLLFLAGQMHPTGFLIAPTTLVLLIYAWVTFPASRKAILIQTFASGIAGLLILAPWMIGLARYVADTGIAAQDQINSLPNRGWGYIIETTMHTLGGYYDHPFKPVLPIVTLIGAIVLLVRLRKRSGFVGLPILLVYTLIPILAWVIDLPYRDYHHRSAYSAAFILMGVALDWLMGLPERLRPVGAGLRPAPAVRIIQWGALSLLLGYLTYNYLAFQWIYDVKLNEQGLPLRIQVDATTHAARLSVEQHKPLIMFVPIPPDSEPLWEWEVMRRLAADAGADVITVWGKSGVPLPETDAVLIAPTTYDDNPLLLADAEGDQFDGVRIAALDSSAYTPDWPIIMPTALTNGATILGVMREDRGSLPAAGSEWVVYLIWRVDAMPTEDQTLFVHLVDAAGNKYGQSDNPALPISEWQVGERVINRFVLDVRDDLPDEGALYLRYGMYGETTSTDAAQMQIRASGEPLATFDEGWALDALTMNTPLHQGQPLEVQSTWLTTSDTEPITLWWEIHDANDRLIMEQLAGLSSVEQPAGQFIHDDGFLRLPTYLAAGTYRLSVGLEGKVTYHREFEIIETRSRTFDAPETSTIIEAEFDDNISLYGYELLIEDQQVTVTLDWFVRELVSNFYTFFVHVIAEDGELVAQHDSAPLGGTYPTFWWAAGEYIRETVTLDLSALGAGRYTIRVGWYNAFNFKRLPILDAGSLTVEDNALILEGIEIE